MSHETETKKLQTIINDGYATTKDGLSGRDVLKALLNDATIAHRQRYVIRKLVEELRLIDGLLMESKTKNPSINASILHARQGVDAAAPYLD